MPNDNPIVFFSHSSKDRPSLQRLKQFFDIRCAGSLEFFLSSDGESIPLGQDWQVEISDALNSARLMFVFISPHSLLSKWIYFEAGHAYSRKIRVIPVCLPGIDLKSLQPPLSLLQGFNLHSHEPLRNIARICNDTCTRRLSESFTREDFLAIFAQDKDNISPCLGRHTDFIACVKVTLGYKRSKASGIPSLDNLKALLATQHCLSHVQKSIEGVAPHLVGQGIIVTFNIYDHDIVIQATLSPNLYEEYLPLLTKWMTDLHYAFDSISTKIEYDRMVSKANHQPIQLLAKLARTQIVPISSSGNEYQFHDLNMVVKNTEILFSHEKSLAVDPRLGQVFDILVDNGILEKKSAPLQ